MAFSFRTSTEEAMASVAAAPRKTSLAMFGVFLGVAALVSLSILSDSGGEAVRQQILNLSSPHYQVAWEEPIPPMVEREGWEIGYSGLETVPPIEARLSIQPIVDRSEGATVVANAESQDSSRYLAASVVVVGDRFVDEVGGVVLYGRDWRAIERNPLPIPTGLIEKGLAERIGFGPGRLGSLIRVDDVDTAIIGVIDLPEETSFEGAVLLRYLDYEETLPNRLLVTTERGLVEPSVRLVKDWLKSAGDSVFTVELPVTPTARQKAITSDLEGLLLALGIVAFVLGLAVIAAMMTVSVVERTGEIAIRRSMGATRSMIGVQFLVEGAMIGAAGGALGSVFGIGTGILVSNIADWPLILESGPLMMGPLAGFAGGMLASLNASRRAARLDPAAALRM